LRPRGGWSVKVCPGYGGFLHLLVYGDVQTNEWNAMRVWMDDPESRTRGRTTHTVTLTQLPDLIEERRRLK
jgi:hypothetical protein